MGGYADRAAARFAFLVDAFPDAFLLLARLRAAGFVGARFARRRGSGTVGAVDAPRLGLPRRGARVSFSSAWRWSLHRSFAKFRPSARMLMVDASGFPHSSQIRTMACANSSPPFGCLILDAPARGAGEPHRLAPFIEGRPEGTGSSPPGKT
jgi:hypothetical protein